MSRKKAKERISENFLDFDSIKLSIASPEKIKQWSFGEVKKPETINYRTFKPERDGLFCERIFGPVRDWECNCGKYKWIKHKGVICDRCGVEVTESKVRRERMGHIDLAAPVSHIWFLRKAPSRIGVLLNMKLGEVERIIYYASYIVVDPGSTPLKKKQLLSEEEFQKNKKEFGNKFKVGIGAKVIKELLSGIDVNKLSKELRNKIKGDKSVAVKNRLIKQLRVVDGFVKSGNRPEWMILTSIPVIPPDLRPLVPLDGGRFASSDLNDLYRRIINRNNRLKLIENLKAPEVMIFNEKRLLQEAVDALFENGARRKVVTGAGGRPLKSLSDVLKGKQGRFRQNLLGKRVDYSGRSVVVIGPNLKIGQCGLPKEMALELFKPFILKELLGKGFASSLKGAKKMLERTSPEVWDVLEEVTKNHPVLLNRAPTLHRLGIQTFEPVLIEGKSIQLHPLVCTAFNADFDGDQMAVHVPLSLEAQMEARVLMLASNNILSPSNGKSIVTPSQDMVLGCCYLTKEKKGDLGNGKIFACNEEALSAYDNKKLSLHAKIKIRVSSGELLETTVGRVIFNRIVPSEMGFINKIVKKKDLGRLVELCFKKLGTYKTTLLLDNIKRLGYKYATLAGISISLRDMKTPKIKNELINVAKTEVKEIETQYKKGFITDTERYNKVIDIWTHVTDKISNVMFDGLREEEENDGPDLPKFNPIYMMADSGARGSRQQIRQLAGMRGLMAKPQKKITGQIGEIIESPIVANFREGLTVLEYFISTHGGRKGLADTALKTADAGYLTRRLVDVAHDVVVNTYDCGTINGIKVGALQEGDEVVESLMERIVGRVSLDNVVNLLTDEIIITVGELISEKKAREIEKAGIEKIRIRSVLTCEAKQGVCAKCYGVNLATGKEVGIGEAVGIIAAQSIGEPGTQLTLRTFHIGGTASRVILRSSVQTKKEGKLKFSNIKSIKNKEGQWVVVSRNGEIIIRESGSSKDKEHYYVPYGAKLKVREGKQVKKAELIAEWDPYSLPIVSEFSGKIKLVDVEEGITVHKEINRITGLEERVIISYKTEKLQPRITIVDKKKKELIAYPLPVDTHIDVYDGAEVFPGDVLAKIPQEVSKTRDITGGLPRVAELFEARKPKNCALISEIDGRVHLGTTTKGVMKIVIENQSGMTREYIVPHGKHLVIYEGDQVRVGEPLTDGSVNPHDILRVKGDKEVQEYLVNEIQEVYRLQGVVINDKHIEAIVRQMLLNVRIEKSGDTELLAGEVINKFKFQEENKKVEKKQGEPAVAYSILLGITKASLSSESFISAASFQETTRVLTEAAVQGQKDCLRGLKENIIIGHLIPAGTGILARKNG
jgi:DNA-directed RNA polymerase subunit beta'